MVIWERLLSDKRLSKLSKTPCPTRSEFQKDTDRIVFSSHFRRLQDKTQVQPFSDSDYIRRRLTHSLEVSSVARSLGADAGKFLQERYPKLQNALYAEQITAAAALAHDIGNPPFGHVGENAIQDWFDNNQAFDLFKGLDEQQKKDLLRFEGNAQGFRILVDLANNKQGLSLTCATMGAFMKYPTASYAIDKNGKSSQNKNGFFQDNQDKFSELCSELCLNKICNGAYTRHPFAFLVEAADDICYRIIDVEDGWKAGRIAFKDAENCLANLTEDKDQYQPSAHSNDENIGWLRAVAIDSVTKAVMSAFRDNEQSLANGHFSSDLISTTCFAEGIKQAEKLAVDYVFKWERVQIAELGGIRMIHELMDDFMDALQRPYTAKGKRIISLLPHYKEDMKPYFQILAVTDYISGMTDSYLRTMRDSISANHI